MLEALNHLQKKLPILLTVCVVVISALQGWTPPVPRFWVLVTLLLLTIAGHMNQDLEEEVEASNARARSMQRERWGVKVE
jgi:hypothetical protein